MQNNRLSAIFLAASFAATPVCLADVSIDNLIDRAGLSEGPVAVRELPPTGNTTGTFDSGTVAASKKDANFINVGRGRTVDTTALLAALQSGHLAVAGGEHAALHCGRTPVKRCRSGKGLLNKP